MAVARSGHENVREKGLEKSNVYHYMVFDREDTAKGAKALNDYQNELEYINMPTYESVNSLSEQEKTQLEKVMVDLMNLEMNPRFNDKQRLLPFCKMLFSIHLKDLDDLY
jgi:hypothetical protein